MIIDIDKLFEDYFRKYIAENLGKYTEDEIEGQVSEIYEKFGVTPQKELGGKSPKEYFRNMSDRELVDCLRESVLGNVPVSDYLCDELENRDSVGELLLEFVSSSVSDELATYAVNILNSFENSNVLSRYVEVLKECKACDSLIEAITEALADNADKVKEEVLTAYEKGAKSSGYFIEILSRMSQDERVFKILIDEFVSNGSNVALNATYLAKYGDERALPYLYDEIKKDGVSYIDYKEMKLAIEALGGEFNDERNFSNDKFFKKLKSN